MKYCLISAILFVFLISCKKTSQTETIATKDKFYFKATVNGRPISWFSDSTKGSSFMPGTSTGYRPDSGKLVFVQYGIGTSIIQTQIQGNIRNGINIYYISPTMPSSFNNVINSFDVGQKQF